MATSQIYAISNLILDFRPLIHAQSFYLNFVELRMWLKI